MGTLYCNGNIYTLVQEGETVEAVYVEGKTITETGTVQSLLKKYGDQLESTIDLGGATMFPGFVDSHLHIIGHGEKLLRRDLSHFTSAEEMGGFLKSEAEKEYPGNWIIGDGWNENNFLDRKIFHRLELDELVPQHPMLLSRVCRHAFLANSKALELAGITKETENPPGGIIVRDENGEATGYLLDSAADLVKKAVPTVTEEYISNALAASVHDLISLGLTGGHTEDLGYYGGFEKTASAFKEVLNGNSVKFKAHLLVHHSVASDYRQSNFSKNESPYIEFGAMKIFSDGAFGGRTALLSRPYNDAPDISGVAIHQPEELKDLVKKARTLNMAVAVHTIGDLSLEYTLEAIRSHPAVTEERDRIIHAGLVRPDLIEQMKQLPIVIDIQPSFVPSDFPWLIERLGLERIPYALAWKTLLDHGLHCAGGSDAPIEAVNPLEGIYAAVTRRKPDETHEGYQKEEKLTAYQAVELYTKGSAYAINKEHSRGRIEAGFDADFTVLDKDILTGGPELILEAKVLYTIIDNSIQYRAFHR
ncbi:amidohydrolase [Fictibacillus terranigra]|uniref:Amidohydrolase n=1 Tax=Fictibacillus terranigra TaxID=3058424 RepID=A0ABT8E3W3_9BACL|nr:amidohydrolase [Fictibacillus sp. CENA-BCM004]MDN4072595.1 amidohydrolase [Fictibacillus sp. CENA-BCM004]